MPDMAVAASIKPPVLQGDVIALFTQGTSKRKIAKELSIDRATVDRIIKGYGQDQPLAANRVKRITPLAYDAVEKALTKGDARIGMDWLKATDLAPQSAPQYRVEGDMHVSQAVNLLPPSSTTDATSSTMSTSTAGTEAAAKHPVNATCIPSHENFSQIPDSVILAEYQRRGLGKPLDVIEATCENV